MLGIYTSPPHSVADRRQHLAVWCITFATFLMGSRVLQGSSFACTCFCCRQWRAPCSVGHHLSYLSNGLTSLAGIMLRMYIFLLLTVQNPCSVGNHLCYLSDGLTSLAGIMLRMYIFLLLTVQNPCSVGNHLCYLSDGLTTLARIMLCMYMFLSLTVEKHCSVGHHLCYLSDGLAPHGGGISLWHLQLHCHCWPLHRLRPAHRLPPPVC